MERNKLIRALIIVVCVYLIITTIQGSVELLKSGEKVTRREKELAMLSKEKQDLIFRNKQAESMSYLERVAYEKLGLSRIGEEVIIVPKELTTQQVSEEVEVKEPNWQKWMRLFF